MISVTLSYAASAVAALPEGSGFVVPRSSGGIVTACSFLDRKWPQRSRTGKVGLRAFVGRAGDSTGFELDDDRLVRRVHAELAGILGIKAPPEEFRVARWPEALAQYGVGHLSLAERIHADVTALGGVEIAGAALDGVGVPACVQSAQDAAARIMGFLGSETRPGLR